MLVSGAFERYVDQTELRLQYAQVRKMYHAYQHDINYSTTCISPFSIDILLKHPKLRSWIRWVNTSVVLNIGLDWETTTRIKLRIAASMLNKVDSLTDLENVQIFTNLKDNVNRELYQIIEEELPF